jgi:ATPase subunit of ABC transporter with duplicated ATPase domains
VAGWILELDRGEGIPYQGNYSSWLEQKQQRLAKEEKAASARQKTLERELGGSAPRARHGQEQGAHQRPTTLLKEEPRRAPRPRKSSSPPRPGWATTW